MNDFSKTKLLEAYDVENFRNVGHQLIDLLANHIASAQQRKQPVIAYKTPEESLVYWQTDLTQKSKPIDFFEKKKKCEEKRFRKERL